MSKKIHRYLLTAMLMVALAACAAPTPTEKATAEPPITEPPAEEKLIVFGDISDDPAEVIEGSQPIVDYLAEKLKDYGITGGQVKVAASTEEMIEWLKNGEVDFCFDSTYPATLLSDASGGQIVLRRWKFGVEEYNSVIFASKESGIKSIEDLKGKMVAMDAPYSTSGYMLPAVYLTEHGLKLAGKASSGDAVAPDEVGFVFAYDDQNVLQWVLDGLTPAGVTDDYNFDKAFPREAAQNLVELARTEKTPRQVLVARPGIDPALLKALVKTLVAMDEDPAAEKALKSFQTTQFDEFPEGTQAALQRIREMKEIIKDIPLP